MSALTAPRIVTIGEAMVLVTPVRAEPLVDAADFTLDVGGAESNVASHCAHLGVPAAWVSSVGSDPLGTRIIRTLRARGVDTTWVHTDRDAPTGVYFKDPGQRVLYFRAGSAASRMTRKLLEPIGFHGVDLVHVTGITPALSDSCLDLTEAAIASAHTAGAKVSFDINYRAQLWEPGLAARTLQPLADRCDIVLVGMDEARALWGCVDATEIRTVFPTVPRLVVKDGGLHATEFSAEAVTTVPALPVDIVEPVGAGDAFAAGYLAALVRGADAEERLASGHVQAAAVLQSTSDFLPPGVESGVATTRHQKDGEHAW